MAPPDEESRDEDYDIRSAQGTFQPVEDETRQLVIDKVGNGAI